MADLLWGQVYYKGGYAGVLRQEPGERCSFVYDASYLASGKPAIAWTLPLGEGAHISEVGLHSFFDNLVAEGWLEEAQTRLLGRRRASRFELLLAFGQDCAGAVSVMDPSPVRLDQGKMDLRDPRELGVLAGRASLSGIQPKLTLVGVKGKYRAARGGETSTHIAKFASRRHEDLVVNEYLTMRAFGALLPEDKIVDCRIAEVEGFVEPALVIKRFDRAEDGGRIHFEEFNQLLGRSSRGKYDGGYKEMGDFIRNTPGCMPAEVYRLFLRILAGLMVGNTDMHFKNFAMLHTGEGLRLAPSYDQVAAALYGYKTVALGIGGVADLSWSKLKAKSVIQLGEDMGMSKAAIMMATEQLAKRKDAALEAIHGEEFGEKKMKNSLIELVRKRWNGTFSLIGQTMLKKRPGGEKGKG